MLPNAILTCIFAITIAISLAAAQNNASVTLLPGTGPYATIYTEFELVDHTRQDPWNASHMRRIMVSRFDPVPKEDCKNTTVLYFPPQIAAAEDEILGTVGWPKGLFERFYLAVCEPEGENESETELSLENQTPAIDSEKTVDNSAFPIALLGPGANTTRYFSSLFAQEIASHGFTVLSMDHPYETDVVLFPDGTLVPGGHLVKPADANGSTESVEFCLNVRAADASFVLDYLGVDRVEGVGSVLIAGQSFGGAAAATALYQDPRFRAGVNVDGTMFGPVLSHPLGFPGHPQAFMLFGSTGHNASNDSDVSWHEFWRSLKGSGNVDLAREFTILNSSHGMTWDFARLVEEGGLREVVRNDSLVELLAGPLSGARVYEILGRYVSSFFKYTLGLEEEDRVLEGENEGFEEVVLLGR